MRFDQLRGMSLAIVAGFGLVWFGLVNSTMAVPLQDGLISYWPLNEGSGTTAADSGPAGSVLDNGEVRNGPTWIDGKFGAGLQFNGVDQDVLIPASTDMDFNSSGLTLSAWVKLDQLPADIAGGFSGIYDSDPDNYVMYLDKGNNELRFKATTSGGGAERPGIPARDLDTTTWHHVMGVFDGIKGSNEVYFDGQLADRHSAIGLVDIVRAGQIASIGSQPGVDPPHEPSSLFQGGVSDVAVWNRALGQAEAEYLYNSGTGNAVGAANPNISPASSLTPVQPTAQPVIYYDFNGNMANQGTGGPTLDATLNDVAGRNDTLYTATTFGQGLNLTENPLSTSTDTDPGDFLSVDYKLAESGTIAMQVSLDKLYNYQTLWANSSQANDWEAWVYEDGRFAARADRGAARLEYNVFLFEDSLAEHHYAYTWERDGDSLIASIYIDGEFQGQSTGPWRDPGDTFFLGGGPGNHLGSSIFDEFRIYESALSEAEILYLSMNAPETTLLVGDYNGDGTVGLADYTVWRNTLGSSVSAGTGADGSGDGIVGTEDYSLWKSHFGQSAGGGVLASSAVPEPASCALLLVTSLGALACLTRRGKPCE